MKEGKGYTVFKLDNGASVTLNSDETVSFTDQKGNAIDEAGFRKTCLDQDIAKAEKDEMAKLEQGDRPVYREKSSP